MDAAFEGVDDIDFRLMCRACALPFDSTVLRDITPPIRDMLLFSIGVEVDLMSELPTQLCGTCYSRADAASQFKLQFQQADEKIRSLLAAKAPPLPLVTSTPSHDVCNANTQFESPKSSFCFLDMPLTPLVYEMLDTQSGTTTGDKSSIANIVDAILDVDTGNIDDTQSQKAEAKVAKESPEHIINIDSVISFLDKDIDSKLSDLDCSLIRSLDIQVDQIKCGTVETDLENIAESAATNPIFDARPDEHNKNVINNGLYVYETAHKDMEALFWKSGIGVSNEEINAKEITNGTGGTNDEELNCKHTENNASGRNEEINNTDAKYHEVNVKKELMIKVVDFIKFAMPEEQLVEELKMLGHIRCRYCYKPYATVKLIYRHLIAKHKMECDACSDGKDYIKLSMPELKVKKRISEYGYARCRYCTLKYKDIITLYAHLHEKHCVDCKWSFSQIKSSPFLCDVCKQVFTRKRYLVKHMWKHQKSIDTWKCEVCAKELSKHTTYTAHMKIHENKIGSATIKSDAKYMCTQCGSMYTNKANLNTHMKRHNTEHPESCPQCGKSFKIRADLKRHLKSHNKEYECSVCKKKIQPHLSPEITHEST